MKAKLISNPSFSDEFPNGLTLHKEYEIIERFKANPYDEYIVFVNDLGEEVSWHTDSFELIDEQSSIEITVFDHKTNTSKRKILTETESERLFRVISFE